MRNYEYGLWIWNYLEVVLLCVQYSTSFLFKKIREEKYYDNSVVVMKIPTGAIERKEWPSPKAALTWLERFLRVLLVVFVVGRFKSILVNGQLAIGQSKTHICNINVSKWPSTSTPLSEWLKNNLSPQKPQKSDLLSVLYETSSKNNVITYLSDPRWATYDLFHDETRQYDQIPRRHICTRWWLSLGSRILC